MKSMTGYGAATENIGKGELYIEIKSINHRFSEIYFRIPNKMGALEGKLRKELQKQFLRGKVEIFIREKSPLFGEPTLKVDSQLAKKYRASFNKLRKEVGGFSSDDFLKYINPERFINLEDKSGSYERMWKPIEKLLRSAIKQANAMRSAEGAHIAKDQQTRIKKLEQHFKRIRARSAKSLAQHIERVKKRVSSGGNGLPFDESRLQAEAAYLGGRQDIAEELTRLESHLSQYLKLVKSPGGVGRRLDFLLQEMNREINTIGAKAADISISRYVVECKAELERLREQVQNVE